MTERMPFEGVNREPRPEPEKRPLLEQLEHAWGLYLAEHERLAAMSPLERLAENPIVMHPDDLERLKAWALENGIHPITGKPYP